VNVLIVHQNFPGQFPHIAAALAKRGDRVAAIGSATAKGMPGVDLRRWQHGRGTTEGIHPQAIRAEADMIRGSAALATALATALALKADGFVPDVILGHPGWGETLYMKIAFPTAKLILFGEYYYLAEGGDSGFDPEFGMPPVDERVRIVSKNATGAMAYLDADRILCPTPWQASSFPAALQPHITTVHEGIDLTKARRRPKARVRTPNGTVLDGSRPVVTFVNRTLEPLRGFHMFMRALPAFLDACPDGHAIVIGEDKASGYGAMSPGGKGWKAALLGEIGDRLDLARVHFMGRVPHDTMIDAFSIGAAHVYYTYPFVLSWSLVEAMATGCLVLAGDTAPVRDAITDGVDGRLLPFFDTAALSDAMIAAAREPDRFAGMRPAARVRALAGFDRDAGTAAWLAAVDAVAAQGSSDT
jgi:glycosyltransferase involved in cell wall biosynthesis